MRSVDYSSFTGNTLSILNDLILTMNPPKSFSPPCPGHIMTTSPPVFLRKKTYSICDRRRVATSRSFFAAQLMGTSSERFRVCPPPKMPDLPTFLREIESLFNPMFCHQNSSCCTFLLSPTHQSVVTTSDSLSRCGLLPLFPFFFDLESSPNIGRYLRLLENFFGGFLRRRSFWTCFKTHVISLKN